MANGESEKHPIFEHTENVAKLATAIVGVLYVLGLLISNVQLMELGVSDFASLQTRNILTGFMFIVYLVLGIALLMPIAWMLRSVGRTLRSPKGQAKLGPCVVTIVTGIVGVLLAAILASLIMGLLYPWGKPFVEGPLLQPKPVTLESIKSDYLVVVSQFAETYFHPRIGLSFILLLYVLFMVPFGDFLYHRMQEFEQRHGRPNPISFKLFHRVTIIIGFFLFSVVFPMILFDYADEVYPNMRYNLGGGQPQVAELLLAGKESDLANLPGAIVCCNSKEPNRNPPQAGLAAREMTLRTDEIAIWYQSDKFIYLTTLGNVGQAVPQVLAVDLRLVRSIRYLPKYVRVYSGGRIKSVHTF